jgi:RNA polymerase sigma-70 factor (ECF subfamily)
MDTTGFNMEACLERARQGDNSAVRELLHELYPLMLKLVRAHLPRRTSEEDLCQMIAIKIVSNLGQYRGGVPIEHWVSRIAINTCLNAVKAEKSRPELRWADLSEEQMNLLNSLAATSDDVRPAAARELVDRLLLELNPQDRLVISLLHLEGRTIAEIRQITGWSAPLVKVRAFRARRKLRAVFDQLTREGKL